MPSSPTAAELGPPPRRTSLTPMGRVLRIAPLIILIFAVILTVIIFYVGRDYPPSTRRLFWMIMAVTFLNWILLFAIAEFGIRRDQRHARTWAAADIAMHDGRCY